MTVRGDVQDLPPGLAVQEYRFDLAGCPRILRHGVLEKLTRFLFALQQEGGEADVLFTEANRVNELGRQHVQDGQAPIGFPGQGQRIRQRVH